MSPHASNHPSPVSSFAAPVRGRRVRTQAACIALLALAPAIPAQAPSPDTVAAPIPARVTDAGVTTAAGLDTATLGDLPPFRPVTVSEYVASVVGPRPIAGVFARAGLDQVRNAPSQWAEDWRGYGNRLSARAAEQAISQGVVFGLSAVMHQRRAEWTRCRCTGAGPRLMHALVMPHTVWTPTGVRVSPLVPLSQVGSAMLVTPLYPDGFAARDGLVNGLTSVLFTAGGSVAREFWPFRWRPSGR